MEASRPPAFIQPAALRNCAYYEQRLDAIEQQSTRAKGEVLKEWKESGTWKEKYKTWAEACEFAASMTKSWANRLIADVSARPVPLSALDTEKAKEVAPNESRPEDNHQPESKPSKQETVKELPKPPTDLSGAVIPQDLLSLVERKSEVSQMEFYASKLHAFFQSVQKDSDPLWRKLRMMATIQTFTSSAQTMQWAIRECCPEVVCPGCGAGSKQNACLTCDGTGMISEVRWNRDWVKSTDKAKQAIVAGRVK